MRTSRLKQFAWIAFLSLLAGSAHAHNPLSHPEWCETGGRLVIVAEIDWNQTQLLEQEPICDAGGQTKSCGSQFDDDWTRGQRTAHHFCEQFAVRFANSRNPDHGTVVFIPSGPTSFLDRDGHHANYALSQGVVGSCVRCEPLPLALPKRR